MILVVFVSNLLIGWAIGRTRNRPLAGILWAFFLGPIGWLVVFVSRPRPVQKCPHCGSILKIGVSVCCHCGRDLVQRINRAPQVVCPICSKVLVRGSLHRGVNICPFCGEPFNIQCMKLRSEGLWRNTKKEALPHGGGPSQNISTLNSIRGFNPSIRVKSRA